MGVRETRDPNIHLLRGMHPASQLKVDVAIFKVVFKLYRQKITHATCRQTVVRFSHARNSETDLRISGHLPAIFPAVVKSPFHAGQTVTQSGATDSVRLALHHPR